MKTLLLNGSPRSGGTIARMLAMAAEIAGNEEDVEMVNVYRAEIKPCTGCMACRRTGVCSLPPDDAHRIAQWIREADLIVVGTPTYWANMSGGLKNLFDRLVPVFMGESPRGMPVKLLRGKRGIIVTACTTPWPFDRLFEQSSGAVRAVREVLQAGGVKTSAIRIAGTKGRKGNVPQRYIARLTRLVLQAKRRSDNK